jgi:hypothetical protein
MAAGHASTDRIIDAASGAGPVPTDRRLKRRQPYTALVGLVLAGSDGERSVPIVLRASDISTGGIRVVSGQMLEPGALGALQLVRSNGQRAIVGFRVRHSRYAGKMRHEIGLEFTPLPEGLGAEDFVDEHGRLVTLDPLLEQNREEAG